MLIGPKENRMGEGWKVRRKFVKDIKHFGSIVALALWSHYVNLHYSSIALRDYGAKQGNATLKAPARRACAGMTQIFKFSSTPLLKGVITSFPFPVWPKSS